MPSEAKPYRYDKYQPFVKIGTDEGELRTLADAIVRGASIAHAEIANLRAVIEAVQSHPKVTVRPPKDADPSSEANKEVKPTELVIYGGHVESCDCYNYDIRLTLDAKTLFGERANFYRAFFGDETSFSYSTFGGWASFDGATFGDRVSFTDAIFGSQASFGEAIFGDEARFDWADFGNEAIFTDATFGHEACFAWTTFGKQSNFDIANFGNHASFRIATLGDRTSFDGATFGEKADFYRATFGDRVSLVDCNLNRASIKDAVFDRADLRRTRGILFDETRIA